MYRTIRGRVLRAVPLEDIDRYPVRTRWTVVAGFAAFTSLASSSILHEPASPKPSTHEKYGPGARVTQGVLPLASVDRRSRGEKGSELFSRVASFRGRPRARIVKSSFSPRSSRSTQPPRRKEGPFRCCDESANFASSGTGERRPTSAAAAPQLAPPTIRRPRPGPGEGVAPSRDTETAPRIIDRQLHHSPPAKGWPRYSGARSANGRRPGSPGS